MRGALGVAAATALLVACNAISGLDDDYRVGPASVHVEGGAPAPAPPPPPPPPASAPVADASAPLDASLDATREAGAPDAVASFACPTGAPFCDDFEDAAKMAPSFGWTRSDGLPNVLPSIGDNGTRGLSAKATAGGASAKVALWKTVRSGFDDGKRMTASFAVKIVSASIDYAVVAAIQLNALEYGLAVYSNASCPGGGLCLDENAPSGSHDFGGAAPVVLGKWYHVDVVVTRTGTAYGGKVVLDGATTLDDRATGALPAGAAVAVEVGAGVFYTGPAGTTETVVDDVVVRYE
jgi:hypothetical protein